MGKDKFDIVFVCHEKDRKSLIQSIKYVRKNISNYRKIFLVAKENFLVEEDIEFVNEDIFPFNKDGIRKYVPKNRVGWYFQQFLKFYFFKAMGNKTLDNILILDADTLFIKKTAFFEKNIPLYNVERGYHQPYYDMMEKLFGFGQQTRFSGITHHMIFQRKYINEILGFVEKRGGDKFWKEVLENVDKNTESGFSEYDLYLNYMLKKHPKKIKIRRLRFINFPYYESKWIRLFKFLGYNYLSAHEYLRRWKFPIFESLSFEILGIFRLRGFVKNILAILNIRKAR